MTAPYFTINRQIGQGTFGKVYLATDMRTSQQVAIKRTAKWKNKVSREVHQLESMDSENIVNLKEVLYTTTPLGYITQNIVMEYVEYNLTKLIVQARNVQKTKIDSGFLRSIIFQLCTGLRELHSMGVAHRDLKPDNILVSCFSGEDLKLKICDLGSAKKLTPDVPSVPYVCSRWYRAPELLLGSLNYTVAVDLWSLGCIMAEVLLLQPLFPGNVPSGIKNECGKPEPYQLVEIIRLLGTPKATDFPNFDEIFPTVCQHRVKELINLEIPPMSFSTVVQGVTTLNEREYLLVELIESLLVWNPDKRLPVSEVLNHPYFIEPTIHSME